MTLSSTAYMYYSAEFQYVPELYLIFVHFKSKFPFRPRIFIVLRNRMSFHQRRQWPALWHLCQFVLISLKEQGLNQKRERKKALFSCSGCPLKVTNWPDDCCCSIDEERRDLDSSFTKPLVCCIRVCFLTITISSMKKLHHHWNLFMYTPTVLCHSHVFLRHFLLF